MKKFDSNKVYLEIQDMFCVLWDIVTESNYKAIAEGYLYGKYGVVLDFNNFTEQKLQFIKNEIKEAFEYCEENGPEYFEGEEYDDEYDDK